MRTLIVNFKNYPEVLGRGSLDLAKAAQGVAAKRGVEVIVAPPTPMLALVASQVKIPVYSQDLGSAEGEKTTGSVLPEGVKSAGCAGTILNHSESRKAPAELKAMVPRAKMASLEVCLCARSGAEAARLSALSPRFVAVEPPELIGTGVAVSRAKPGLIRSSVKAVRRAGFSGEILCGAGIASGEDVKKAVELGADGVLVASSVVKAKDWKAKLDELACSLI
jgi:triosephosphate isomerase (TIM)